MKPLMDLAVYAEKNFTLGKSGDTSKTEDGHVFVTLASCGIKKEGEGYAKFFHTVEQAKESWKTQFDNYAKGTTLHWRLYPTLILTKEGFAIRSRLVVI